MFHPGKDFFPFSYLNLSDGLNIIPLLLCCVKKKTNNKRGLSPAPWKCHAHHQTPMGRVDRWWVSACSSSVGLYPCVPVSICVPEELIVVTNGGRPSLCLETPTTYLQMNVLVFQLNNGVSLCLKVNWFIQGSNLWPESLTPWFFS